MDPRYALSGGSTGLKICDSFLQGIHLGAGARQKLALDFKLFAGDQVEAAQSLRQDIAEVGAQILMRLSQS